MSKIVQEILKKHMKNSDHFIPDEIVIKGHSLGYVSERDIDVTAMPKEAVSSCKNMDFPPGYDKVREPYQLYADLSANLPSGYELARFCEKSFVDGDGNAQKVLIYAATKPDQKLKIFASHYYLPTQDYDNANKYETYTDPEWRSEHIELTEHYKHDGAGIQYVLGTFSQPGGPYQIKVLATGASDAAFGDPRRNHFRGWYVINGDNVVGIVTASIAVYSGNTYAGTYFQVVLEDNITLTDLQVGLCRFPVNQFNTDNWANIEDVRFESDFPNAVKIWCGDTSRPLNLSFITKRTYFSGASTTQPAYYPNPPGDWLTVQGIPEVSSNRTYRVRLVRRYDVSAFLGINTLLQFGWSVSTGGVFGAETLMPEIWTYSYQSWRFDVVQELTQGLSVRLQSTANLFTMGDRAEFDIAKGASASWNGFWLGFDIPEVDKKKWYKYIDVTKTPNNYDIAKTDIGQELGIRYNMVTDHKARTGTEKNFDKVYSLAVELDGYQSLFVKNVFLGKVVGGSPDDDDFLKIDVYFSPAFDRRITAHMLYYAEDVTIDHLPGADSAEYELPETSRFNDIKRGYYAVSKMGASKNGGSWKVVLMNTVDEALVDSAIGEKLSVDRLNNPYWYNVVQKAEFAMRVGENVVAVHLSNDYANADKETQQPNSNGAEAICVSQLQSGANAASVMSTKRIRQISKGYPLVAGAWTVENQFVLFTAKESFWMDITEEETLQIRRIAIFDDCGLVHADALITARELLASQAGPLTAPLSSLFKGVYFASEKSIYEIRDNKPVDLLMYDDGVTPRWRTEYQEIADKTAIRAGYRANTKDVYFSIPELGEIRVWNIPGNHWKSYTFPDAVKYFMSDVDGEVMFNTGNKIYKTEKVGTEMTMDKGTERIDFEFSQWLNHGNSQLMKVLDGFEFTYDLEGVDTVKLHLKVEAADDRVASGLSTVFDEDITIRGAGEAGKFYERRGYPSRERGQWYKVTVSSTADTAERAATLKLLMLKLKALFTRGNVTRQ